MGTITIRVSDLTGRQIEDETQAARLVVEHPDFSEPITMEVLPEEIEEKLPEGSERFVALSYFAPQESTVRRFLLPIDEFNNLFEEPREEEGILDKLQNLLFGQQEEKPARGRQRRRRGGQRRERIDWSSPERAGLDHPGRISRAEREYVSTHVEEVNQRRIAAGQDPLEPSDLDTAEKYGLTPVEPRREEV